MSELNELFDALPDPIKRDLQPYVDSGDIDWVNEMAQRYHDADEYGKADILAFHDCNGVPMVEISKLKEEGLGPEWD